MLICQVLNMSCRDVWDKSVHFRLKSRQEKLEARLPGKERTITLIISRSLQHTIGIDVSHSLYEPSSLSKASSTTTKDAITMVVSKADCRLIEYFRKLDREEFNFNLMASRAFVINPRIAKLIKHLENLHTEGFNFNR